MESSTDHSAQKDNYATATGSGVHSMEYAPYPKIDPADIDPPPPPLAMRSDTGHVATSMPAESNPYVTPSSVPSSSKSEFHLLFIFLFIWDLLLWNNRVVYDFGIKLYRHHGVSKGCFGEVGKEVGRYSEEDGGSCWERLAAL